MKPRRPWWVWLGVFAAAGFVGLLFVDSGHQPRPITKQSSPDLPAADLAAVKNFQGLVAEYQVQGAAAKAAKPESDEAELAQLHQHFCWLYASAAYKHLNASERLQAADERKMLPDSFVSGYMRGFASLLHRPEEILEKQYRESLEARGLRVPEVF